MLRSKNSISEHLVLRKLLLIFRKLWSCIKECPRTKMPDIMATSVPIADAMNTRMQRATSAYVKGEQRIMKSTVLRVTVLLRGKDFLRSVDQGEDTSCNNEFLKNNEILMNKSSNNLITNFH